MRGLVHVVDDDAPFRTAIERLLKKEGYNVATYPLVKDLLDHLPDEGEPGVRIPGLSGETGCGCRKGFPDRSP